MIIFSDVPAHQNKVDSKRSYKSCQAVIDDDLTVLDVEEEKFGESTQNCASADIEGPRAATTLLHLGSRLDRPAWIRLNDRRSGS